MDLIEEVARELYDCEKRRAEIVDDVLSGVAGRKLTPSIEAYEENADSTWRRDALAVTRLIVERCAEKLREKAEAIGKQECCGIGQYSGYGPPECCCDPLLMFSDRDAIDAILSLLPQDAALNHTRKET